MTTDEFTPDDNPTVVRNNVPHITFEQLRQVQPDYDRVGKAYEAGVLAKLDQSLPQKPPVIDVVVLIPAHNEEEWIQRTIGSLQTQTYPVSRILVMADNCTDRTVELARATGAEVVETVDNSNRKAGAMNQGFDMLLPHMKDTDVIMGMDGDGIIAPDAIEVALEIFRDNPELGGVSGSVRCREPRGWLETAQVLEYERGRRLMSRSGGKIHVLSGAAAFIRVKALKDVAEARGTILPGTKGSVMLDSNIVEDYELTLAIKKLGYGTRSSKRCQMFSDLMKSIKELEGQRMRWYRGTIETIHLYGVSWETMKPAIAIAFNLVSSWVMAFWIFMMIFGYLAVGAGASLWFLILTPIFIAEYLIVSKTIPGWRSKVFAASFFPMFLYGNLLFLIYWRAAWHALTKKSFAWQGDQTRYV